VNLSAAAAAALWGLYDASGIRPEWILPTLHIESGFDPSLPNRAGAPYYGIAQNGERDIAAAGATPAEYLTWTAEEQLTRVVAPYFARLVKLEGPLRSGVRVYQGNYLPGTLRTARALWQVIAWKGTPAYDANVVLDASRDGAITVSDLALVVAEHAASSDAQAALSAAYAARPTERASRSNPVYGKDFTDPLWWLLAPAGTAAYAFSR
jgi:hypothetical protein